MKRVLSPWCKQVQIRLIELDMSVNELAEKIGLSRVYTSALINGRVFSEPAVKAISDVLNIKDNANSL